MALQEFGWNFFRIGINYLGKAKILKTRKKKTSFKGTPTSFKESFIINKKNEFKCFKNTKSTEIG